MKKLIKILFSLVLIGGAVAGVFYFIKSFFAKDYLHDFDDDFDNDLYDEEDDEDDREYVTITPQTEEE